MHHTSEALTVRTRTVVDLQACVRLASEVQHLDGYPSFLGDGGLTSFVAPEDGLDAWVADLEGDVVGNVVLRPRSAPTSVVLAAEALGVAPGRLGFVARLMVAPRARRRGVARQLLQVVVDGAVRRGLVPVLDVVTSDVAAIALYEATGWRHLGDRTFTMRTGGQLSLKVFASPATPRRGDAVPVKGAGDGGR